MKITVFCASAMGNDPIYQEAARRLGARMAEKGLELVYGGESSGTMGVIADAVLEGGGSVTGVLPETAFLIAGRHRGLTEYVYTKNMFERKDAMIRLADAFIALPGGEGTLDELSDVLSLMKIGEIDKPMVLLNVKSYYEPLRVFFEKMAREGFASPKSTAKVLISENPEEIEAFLGIGGSGKKPVDRKNSR